MREILFRGERVDNGEWIKGDLIENQGDHYIYEASDVTTFACGCTTEVSVCCNQVVSSTVGQFTGLPDKFGNRIFEGDIIEITLPLSGYKPIIERSEVYFDRGCFCVNWHGTRTRMDGFASHVTFEIIGNVHDNPELLRDSSSIEGIATDATLMPAT